MTNTVKDSRTEDGQTLGLVELQRNMKTLSLTYYGDILLAAEGVE